MNIKKIGENIRMVRARRNISLKKLAKKSGIDYANLTHIESGKDRHGNIRKNVHAQTLFKIATALNVSIDDLYQSGIDQVRNKIYTEYSEISAVKHISDQSAVYDSGQDWGNELSPAFTRKVPVLNKIPAGDVVDVTDQDFPVRFAEEYVMADVKDENAYALVVTGDSMVTSLNEGDYVIVSPSTELHNNSTVVFRLRDGNAGVKRFRQVGKTVMLEPDNKDFVDLDGLNNREYNIKEFMFIHKVVGVYKKM